MRLKSLRKRTSLEAASGERVTFVVKSAAVDVEIFMQNTM